MTNVDNNRTVYIVDDDEGVRESLSLLLRTVDLKAETFASAMEFLDDYNPGMRGCLLLDVRMPVMTGMQLQGELQRRGCAMPIIFLTGHGDIPMAVEAMKRGAIDFIRKPFREQVLLERINEALKIEATEQQQRAARKQLLAKLGTLTAREREIFDLVAEGMMNKVIAIDCGISERTVEVHRSQIMKKLQARSLADLVKAKIAVTERLYSC